MSKLSMSRIIQFAVVVFLISANPSPAISRTTLSVGPSNNTPLFKIDPNKPNNFGLYQGWGFVFTVPSGEAYLANATFFIWFQSSSDAATYAKIRLRAWDDNNSQPTGFVIFDNAQITPGGLVPGSLDSELGILPALFPVCVTVAPNQKYIFEIIGNGTVGMNTATGYADGGLFEAVDTDPITITNIGTWAEFGTHDLRTEMVFLNTTPSKAALDLITTIGGMGLPTGVVNSLSAPLNQVSNILDDTNSNNDCTAFTFLNTFITQVNKKRDKGDLTLQDANQLLLAADAINVSFDCYC